VLQNTTMGRRPFAPERQKVSRKSLRKDYTRWVRGSIGTANRTALRCRGFFSLAIFLDQARAVLGRNLTHKRMEFIFQTLCHNTVHRTLTFEWQNLRPR